jgi:hypothetical protein
VTPRFNLWAAAPHLIHRSANEMDQLARLLERSNLAGANSAVVIFYFLLLAHNLQGIAIGWVLGEVVNLVLFVLGGVIVARQHRRNFGME